MKVGDKVVFHLDGTCDFPGELAVRGNRLGVEHKSGSVWFLPSELETNRGGLQYLACHFEEHQHGRAEWDRILNYLDMFSNDGEPVRVDLGRGWVTGVVEAHCSYVLLNHTVQAETHYGIKELYVELPVSWIAHIDYDRREVCMQLAPGRDEGDEYDEDDEE